MDISSIVQHYEKCLAENDDPLLQVDWTNKEAAEIRYHICKNFYFGFIPDVFYDEVSRPNELLDLGCGLGELANYFGPFVNYIGCDISPKMVKAAKKRFPDREFFVYEMDKLPKSYDVIVMNGVFTERRELDYWTMIPYFKAQLKEILDHCNKGLIFNVMNYNRIPFKDQRAELFFVPYDNMAHILDTLGVKHYDFYIHPKLNDYFVKVYK